MSDRTIPGVSVVSDGNEKPIDAALRYLREYLDSVEWVLAPGRVTDVPKHFSTIRKHIDAQHAVINALRDEVRDLKWKLANPQWSSPTKHDDFTGLLGELLQRIVRLENVAHHHINPNVCNVRKL